MDGDTLVRRWVEDAQKGDRAAFQALYEHFSPRIYNFLYRLLGSRDEAEDVAQQTFLNAFRQLGALRDVAQVESWIYRIARNEVYLRFRRKKTISIDDDETGINIEQLEESRLGANPERLLLNEELGRVIQIVLDNLPPKLKEVFILAVIQGLSYQDVTEIVGRSLLSVKTDIYRARLLAKNEIRKYLDHAERKQG